MLYLADTSIRIYKKKNSNTSYRLKSYLLVKSKTNFSLDSYLTDISASLTLPSGKVIDMEDISVSVHLAAEQAFDTMMYLFWASGQSDTGIESNSLGELQINYHLSFNEEPEFIKKIVPLIVRTRKYKGN